MRLIDVEPIIKDLSAMKTQLGYDAIDIDGMIKALRETEEVDAVPVVHGRWKYHKYVGKYECMECGRFVRAGTEGNYCPNCGAKMDLPENGE